MRSHGEVREPVAIVSIVAFQNKRLSLPDDLQPEIRALIADCWEESPDMRPSMQEVLSRLSLVTQIVPSASTILSIEHV